MIRRLQETDIDRVMELWLGVNLKAHDRPTILFPLRIGETILSR